jgi:cell cycle checkpoint control protein RAD9A
MQAVLDSHGLKGSSIIVNLPHALIFSAFTKALFCLSKYGDDLTLHATADVLALSTTNSSKSAYCRFRLAKTFFSRYHLEIPSDPDSDEMPEDVIGQVLTKVKSDSPRVLISHTVLGIQSLLSVLKHKTMDKSVERCELNIHDGIRPGYGIGNKDVESKLIVRIHCKHGK